MIVRGTVTSPTGMAAASAVAAKSTANVANAVYASFLTLAGQAGAALALDNCSLLREEGNYAKRSMFHRKQLKDSQQRYLGTR